MNRLAFESQSCLDGNLVDSGATTHIFSDPNLFISFDKNFDKHQHTIVLADGSKHPDLAKAKGTVIINLKDLKGICQAVTLKGALYIPSSPKNIISIVRAMSDDNMEFNFSKHHSEMVSPEGHVFEMVLNESLHHLYTVNLVEKSLTDIQWHNTLGHLNYQDLLQTSKVVNGMKIIKTKVCRDCEICIQGKMFETISKTPDRRAKFPFEFIHTDIHGPKNITNPDKYNYVVNFVCDYSGFIAVYNMVKKSDVVIAFQQFLADHAPYGCVKRLCSDNGTEYTSHDFKSIILKHQIKHEFSSPYTSWQNGTAERCWRTLGDMSRCLLFQNNLPESLWPYAYKSAAYIRNRVFNPRIKITPYEAAMGKRPNLSNMHIFGSRCFSYVQNKSKMEPRAQPGIFVGYDTTSPAFFVYFPDKYSIKRIRSVRFPNEFTNLHELQNDNNDSLKKIINKDAGLERDISMYNNLDINNDLEQLNRYPIRTRSLPKRLGIDQESDYVSIEEHCNLIMLDACYNVSKVPKNL